MVETDAIDAPPPLDALRASGAVALFLDFDGTLIEIAPTPDAICVPVDLVPRLEALAGRHGGRLALISGRSLANLAGHLGGMSLARAGSHGIERLRADGTALGEPPIGIPPAASAAVRDFAKMREGVEFEEKSHGAALHFRAAPELAAEAISFAETLAALHGLAIKQGKCVVELVDRGADKAAAVHAFMGEGSFAGALPIFIGDDVTDEDGFRRCLRIGRFWRDRGRSALGIGPLSPRFS